LHEGKQCQCFPPLRPVEQSFALPARPGGR
jgi:hypothetical protein